MKFDRHWRGWRFLERVALWTTFVACTFVAAQPLRERLSAWQSQRALEARWQQASQREKSASTPTPQLKVGGYLASHHRSKPGTTKNGSAKKETATKKNGEAQTKKSANAEKDSAILWPLARLSCSRMKLDAVVVQGTDDSQLKRGPGHEADTSLPGGPNCVIAAHRNAYGWWFYRLNDLQPGDFVVLQVPERKFIYRVAASRVVSVNDTSILRSRPEAAPRLTLYSCTLPKTERRLVVIANLTSSQDL